MGTADTVLAGVSPARLANCSTAASTGGEIVVESATAFASWIEISELDGLGKDLEPGRFRPAARRRAVSIGADNQAAEQHVFPNAPGGRVSPLL
jgi:hypothetical protein